MPFYRWLRPHPDDDPDVLHQKRRTADNLLRLRAALRAEFATDVRTHLRLATWNLREFGSTAPGRQRTEESLYYIAEILSHFDLIAIQEVREDMTALKKLLKILGPSWQYIATDVTAGVTGNKERMAFIYETTQAEFVRNGGRDHSAEELSARR